MTSGRFLKVALPLAVIVALLTWALPSAFGARYAQLMHPGALTVAAALAIWVAVFYRGSMRGVFFLLAGFLLLYSMTTNSWVVEEVAELLGSSFLRVLLVYQVVTYAFLLTASALVVRLMDVRRLNRAGIAVTAGAVLLAAVLLIYFLPTFRDLTGEVRIILLLIRIFDMLILAMLVPVMWLYVQSARSKYQESGTFMLVTGGIVASLVSVYLYELVKQDSLLNISINEYQAGSVLDALYLFGYLVVAIGLFAHRKHHEWVFARLDDLLA
jgi:hypothetical protein